MIDLEEMEFEARYWVLIAGNLRKSLEGIGNLNDGIANTAKTVSHLIPLAAEDKMIYDTVETVLNDVQKTQASLIEIIKLLDDTAKLAQGRIDYMRARFNNG